MARTTRRNTTPRLPSAGPEALSPVLPPLLASRSIFFCRFSLPFLVAVSRCRFWLPFCTTSQCVPDCPSRFTTHGGHLCPSTPLRSSIRGSRSCFFTMPRVATEPRGVIFCCSLFVSIRVHPCASVVQEVGFFTAHCPCPSVVQEVGFFTVNLPRPRRGFLLPASCFEFTLTLEGPFTCISPVFTGNKHLVAVKSMGCARFPRAL